MWFLALPSVFFSFVSYKSQTSADDVIINQLQAISQFFSVLFMATDGKNVYLVKLGPKSFGDGCRTFARTKHAIWGQLLATKAEIIQSKPYFRFACKTEDFVIWNFCFCSLSKGIFNVLTRCYVWAWNMLTVINKIMFTSPEAMVEFPGEKRLKLSLSARQKPF